MLHRTCRGKGDGMYALEPKTERGSPGGDRGGDQLANSRETGWADCSGAEARRLMKPGSAGTGSEPQLETNATSDKGPRLKEQKRCWNIDR
jgi:hypothetical protein